MHRRPQPHEWERYGPLAAGYAPDAGAPQLDWGGDEPELGAEQLTPQEAGEELAHLLINLRLKGDISAKQCCILAYWASAAGAVGPCAEFAMPPDRTGGRYQRKLDQYLKVAADLPLYTVPTPGHDRGTADRVVHDLQMMPPHEALAAELAGNPGILQELARTPPGTWGPT